MNAARHAHLRDDHRRTLQAVKLMYQRHLLMLRDELRQPDLTLEERAAFALAIAETETDLGEVDAAFEELEQANYDSPPIGRLALAGVKRKARKRRKRLEIRNGR